MRSRTALQTALGLCTAALLAGCMQAPAAPAASSQVQPQVARPAYILSVHPRPGDTAGSLEARYHGRVMELGPDHALIGLDAAAARRVGGGHLGALDLTSGAEPNLGVFSAGGSMTIWSGGSMTIWSGGSMTIWSGGSMTIWSGGQYAPVPGNSAAFAQINLQAAQNAAPKLGRGVKVAVIDTGLDLTHPAFAGSLDLAGARDYVDGDTVPQDEGTLGTGAYGHGTAVASIILQVAPGATILPLRVLGPDGSGDAATVASAIRYAADSGARIINLSLGSESRVTAVRDAVVYATGKNVTVVSSVGNSNLETLTYPAMDASGTGAVPDHQVSVGSLDGAGLKASFSNFASNLEVSAPGVSVYAAVPGGLLGAWSGTSMSAPMVAGGLALAAGQLTSVPGDMGKKVRDNANNSIYSNGQNGSYNNKLGRGRLDLSKFLSALKITAP